MLHLSFLKKKYVIKSNFITTKIIMSSIYIICVKYNMLNI